MYGEVQNVEEPSSNQLCQKFHARDDSFDFQFSSNDAYAKEAIFAKSIRHEEGTGDEEDLKGEIVIHIQNGEDAHYDESRSRWNEEYPVIRLSSFTRKTTCLTAMIRLMVVGFIIHHMLGAESTSRAAPQWLQLLAVFGVSVCLKTLLVPAYFSTDFDVHQNWLRITATRPLSEWYWDEESKWTLDYPPLFAYFEWLLAQIAIAINPAITANINRDQATVLFQRASVILSEVPMLLVLYQIIGRVDFRLVVAYFSLPFIILDNVHFQYNILMQALFLLAVHLLQKQRFLYSALTYATLLNFKHIYLYASLAFFAYILKHYVLAAQGTGEKAKRLVKVGAVTLLPFIVAFLPFLIAGLQQIPQILSRLFPFQRGLIHDYWAPNFWALYYFADKVINLVVARLGGTGISFEAASELHRLRVLPQVSPFATNIIVLLITLPLLAKMIKHKISANRLVFLCGAVFFLFGFHVHEKAITPYVGLLLVFAGDAGRDWLLGPALMVNLVNLLPLLIAPNEKLLRLALPLLWVAIWQYRHGAGGLLETTIFAAGIAVTAYQELLHPLLPFRSLQFLPLMINSVFAATFNIAWITFLYVKTMRTKEDEEQRNDGFKPLAGGEQADA